MKMLRWLIVVVLGVVTVGVWTASVQAGFVDNGNDGTVSDTSTGLMWQQDTARDAQGNYDTMTWAEALAYCEDLEFPEGGYTDWRLPTIKELGSLVDLSQYDPAIDRSKFPNTVSSYYWSSTTYASDTDGAWRVDFYDGYDGYGYKVYSNYVRAVRGGQSGSFDYSIISTAGTGGTISPSGTVGVNSGGSVTFTITPDSGYQIADVKVDGDSQGAISSHTFTNVTRNYTILASFVDETPTCISPISVESTVNGSWTTDCNSTHSSGRYAKYYTFTLSSTTDVQLDLQSTVDTYLYLLSGSGMDGQVEDEDDDGGDGSNSQLQKTLSAGTYTIEATTYYPSNTGSFTLSVVTAGPSCIEPISLESTVNGSWTSDCDSTNESGSYAKYYTFSVSSDTNVQLDLQSTVDTYLYLLSGSGMDGQVVDEDDDGGDGSNSRITMTLSAGTYTIEATTYYPSATGSFTLSVACGSYNFEIDSINPGVLPTYTFTPGYVGAKLTISGKVTNATGNPVSNESFDIEDAISERSIVEAFTTTADGQFFYTTETANKNGFFALAIWKGGRLLKVLSAPINPENNMGADDFDFSIDEEIFGVYDSISTSHSAWLTQVDNSELPKPTADDIKTKARTVIDALAEFEKNRWDYFMDDLVTRTNVVILSYAGATCIIGVGCVVLVSYGTAALLKATVVSDIRALVDLGIFSDTTEGNLISLTEAVSTVVSCGTAWWDPTGGNLAICGVGTVGFVNSVTKAEIRSHERQDITNKDRLCEERTTILSIGWTSPAREQWSYI